MPARGGAGKQLDSPAVRDAPAVGATPEDPTERTTPGDDPGGNTSDYLTLLEGRVHEITQSVREGRVDECISQLLTLETSSHAAGADELSLRAAALRIALGHHQPDVGVVLSDLTRAARFALEGLPHGDGGD